MRVNRSFRDRLRAAWRGFHGVVAVESSGPRLLAEQAPDLITRHAPDGRIRLAGGAAALLGRPLAELEGLTPRDLVHPDDLAAVQAAFRDASYFGRDGAVTARFLHADGRALWMELRCRRTPMDAQGGGDILAVTREIAAFKAQSAALMAQSAALAEAAMPHWRRQRRNRASWPP